MSLMKRKQDFNLFALDLLPNKKGVIRRFMGEKKREKSPKKKKVLVFLNSVTDILVTNQSVVISILSPCLQQFTSRQHHAILSLQKCGAILLASRICTTVVFQLLLLASGYVITAVYGSVVSILILWYVTAYVVISILFIRLTISCRQHLVTAFTTVHLVVSILLFYVLIK